MRTPLKAVIGSVLYMTDKQFENYMEEHYYCFTASERKRIKLAIVRKNKEVNRFKKNNLCSFHLTLPYDEAMKTLEYLEEIVETMRYRAAQYECRQILEVYKESYLETFKKLKNSKSLNF
jgi:hypothetical protein